MEKLRALVKEYEAIIPWLLLAAIGGVTFLVLQRGVLKLLR